MGVRKNRLAVLADCLPSEESTAGSVLRNIVMSLPDDWEVKILVIRNPYLPPERVGFIPNVQITMFAEPQSDWKGVLLPPLRRLGEALAQREGATISEQIRVDLQDFSPDYFLIIPQTHLVAQVAVNLDSVLQNCVRLSIMTDHFSWWARTHGLSKKETNRFARNWQSLFESAQIRIVPSERANSLFSQEIGKSIVLYPTFERTKTVPSKTKDTREAIRIAFAGEDYAKREIEIFLSSLSAVEGRIQGKAVEFHHFGKTTLSQNIFTYTNRGRVHPGNLVDVLSEFDFAFLPYPTEPEMAIVSETSFPSKLASYVASGLPVIYLGPEERSAAWEYICAAGIGGSARDFLSGDQSFIFKNRSRALSQSYEKSFSNSVFQRTVAEIFGLPDQFLSKRESSKNQKRNPTPSFDLNRFGTWISAADSELLDFETINRFSASRALRFLSSPIWIVSKGLGLIRKHDNGYAFSVAKNLIRGLGKIVSKKSTM